MKKLLVVWIAVLFIVCIAARFLVRSLEGKKVATTTSIAAVTPKVTRVVIPEKKVEAAETPRVESEKPEEVEKLKAEIATLGQKLELLEQAQKPSAEIPEPVVEKRTIPVYEPRYQTEEPQEPEEQEYHARPFVYPILCLDVAFNPFWYYYYQNWCWSGFYYYSYFWGWPYWTRPYYSYEYGRGYGYDFYRSGRSVIQNNQLQAPHSRFSKTSTRDSGRFDSPWGDLRGTQTLRRSTASPRSSSLSRSTSPRSYSNSRSFRSLSRSSSTRSAPSRSSGSIRKK